MKATKFIVLGAGLIGLIGFFLPLIAVQGVNVPISAFTLVRGADAMQDAAGGQGDKMAKDLDDAAGAVKAIVLGAYAPALLCFLFGLIGTLKKSFGRGLGFGSLIFGLITFGLYVLLSSAAKDAGAQTGAGDATGPAMYMMLVSGLGCTVGGLIALVKPDRGDGGGGSHPRHAATIKA